MQRWATTIPHAVMAVNNGGGQVVADHFELSDRLLDLLVDDPIVVDRFKPPDAVGVDPALVGGDKHIRANPGVVFRYADPDENIGHESFHLAKGNVMLHAYRLLIVDERMGYHVAYILFKPDRA